MAQRRRQCRRSYRSDRWRRHLCYIEAQGFHLAEKREPPTRETKARFRCDHCGRMARTAVKLCVPIRWQDADRHDAGEAEDNPPANPG
jgi:hypothetical protein